MELDYGDTKIRWKLFNTPSRLGVSPEQVKQEMMLIFFFSNCLSCINGKKGVDTIQGFGAGPQSIKTFFA